MSSSIFNDTKKVLGLAEDDKAFDLDILMHINTVFSTLSQLGLGPEEGFAIEDAAATWDSFLQGDKRYNMIKSYMFLKVRMLFDPPGTSYLMTAYEKQIQEMEWRLSSQRETTLPPVVA